MLLENLQVICGFRCPICALFNLLLLARLFSNEFNIELVEILQVSYRFLLLLAR